MAVSLTLPAWPPPALAPAQVSFLTTTATDFALAHGLVYRPPLAPGAAPEDVEKSAVIHAPFALLPSPFPRALFSQAARLQPVLNELYARVASDHAFLQHVFVQQHVVDVDAFQHQLWRIYEAVRQEPLAQPLQLGLFRSDYLLHDESPHAAPGDRHSLSIKQVEFNTISSSFGPLCTEVSRLHHYLADLSRNYFGALPPPSSPGSGEGDPIPTNEALDTLAGGIAGAHDAYLRQALPRIQKVPRDPVVLLIVQPGERNAFDQRALEYTLATRHGVKAIRLTMAELAGHSPSSHHAAKLRLPEKELFVTPPWADLSKGEDAEQVEVSVVYYRAGYGPTDYEGKGNEKNWDVRLLLERSKAIKCPSVALQLAGAKKVQQVLAQPGVLESFLQAPSDPESKDSNNVSQTWDASTLALIRSTWTDLYSLDPSLEEGKKAYELALNEPQKFVLKPQREGGGNNIYKEDIPPALKEMEERDRANAGSSAPSEREGYILMSLIQPPPGLGSWLVKAGAGAEGAALASDVVSELGIYGTALFSREGNGAFNLVDNTSGGHLLRTKGRNSNEGGVAVGFSVIDSPYLL